ncbi:MAG: class I SAM-dependent methyltransferase [Candidatus Latescibacterota bacterium]
MAWEHHEIGAETLRRMSVLERYNDWILEKISPWVGERVLEVGAGIGNISQYFLDRRELCLTDVQEDYLGILREKFGAYPHITIARYNLEECADCLHGREFDTILVLNVLEHIENDIHALREMSSLLAPEGRVILQLPAHRLLYGALDINLDHFRRYTARDIRQKFSSCGLETERLVRFNLFGALGWLLCSRVLRRKILPEGQLGLFNLLTPAFMAIERTVPVPFGLSLLAVGRKPGSDARTHPDSERG